MEWVHVHVFNNFVEENRPKGGVSKGKWLNLYVTFHDIKGIALQETLRSLGLRIHTCNVVPTCGKQSGEMTWDRSYFEDVLSYSKLVHAMQVHFVSLSMKL